MEKTQLVGLSFGLFIVGSVLSPMPLHADVGVTPTSLSFGSDRIEHRKCGSYRCSHKRWPAFCFDSADLEQPSGVYCCQFRTTHCAGGAWRRLVPAGVCAQRSAELQRQRRSQHNK